MIAKIRIKPKRWAYLAGLIDGDGSITIRFDTESGYQLTTCVYSTYRPLMKWLVRKFGGSFRKVFTEGNRKQKYQWYTSCGEVASLTSPYLILKYLQGQIATQFVSLGSERNPDARKELMSDLQRANQTFIPVDPNNSRLSQFVEPTKIDFAYLAGLFDSEGSFSIFKRKPTKGNGKYTSCARISNTDNRLFPWLVNRFGGNFSVTKRVTRSEGTWSLSGKKDRETKLLAVLPYLVIKKERATLLLMWMQNVAAMTLEEKEQTFLKMKSLNHRGLSPEANTSRLPEQEDKIESELIGDYERVSPVMAMA